jgi:hypothetical protein
MKYKRFLPLSTFAIFVVLNLITSNYFPSNSWGGNLIFFLFFLPVSLLASTLIVMINSRRVQIIAVITFYILFFYFFFLLYPTIDEMKFLGIYFN